MHIIESNPALYERLAAALNVQLRLGGVHIADTDLFQRDVTRFLNADIRPIYFVAKQLLRTLPVYFNEVGAEGELRSVSTEIDEICGRRDSLHALSAQAAPRGVVEPAGRRSAAPCCATGRRSTPRVWSRSSPPTSLAAVQAEGQWAQGPHEVLVALPPAACRRAARGAGRPARAARGLRLDQLRDADPGRALPSGSPPCRHTAAAGGRRLRRRRRARGATPTGAAWP